MLAELAKEVVLALQRLDPEALGGARGAAVLALALDAAAVGVDEIELFGEFHARELAVIERVVDAVDREAIHVVAIAHRACQDARLVVEIRVAGVVRGILGIIPAAVGVHGDSLANFLYLGGRQAESGEERAHDLGAGAAVVHRAGGVEFADVVEQARQLEAIRVELFGLRDRATD